MAGRSTKDRRSAFWRGHLSEYYAALSLLLKGYRIVAIRYKTKAGEIDIIARKGALIAFVEVKARKRVDDSINAVNATTQRRIRNAGDIWLMSQRDAHMLSLRYDIVAVSGWRWPKHFPDAF